jgi:hypothetical protein
MKKFKLLLLMFVINSSSIFAAEETIIDYTTYQTKVTNRDIVQAFSDNVRTYWGRNSYYLCQYEIYQGRSEQNYAWRFRVIKNTYDWGIVFSLILNVSNGYFTLKLSNTSFVSGGADAKQIETGYGVYHDSYSVKDEYSTFAKESRMTLKMNNDDYGQESRSAFSAFTYVYF